MEEAWPDQNLVCLRAHVRVVCVLVDIKLPIPVQDFSLDMQSGIPLQACVQQQIPCQTAFCI